MATTYRFGQNAMAGVEFAYDEFTGGGAEWDYDTSEMARCLNTLIDDFGLEGRWEINKVPNGVPFDHWCTGVLHDADARTAAFFGFAAEHYGFPKLESLDSRQINNIINVWGGDFTNTAIGQGASVHHNPE